MKYKIIFLALNILFCWGCMSDEGPRGIDYQDIKKWTTELSKDMLNSGFLINQEYGSRPILMVVSDIDNKTDISFFPIGMIFGPIRSELIRSGKFKFVNYGPEGEIDPMPRRTIELKRDPVYETSHIKTQDVFKVARLSLRTEILLLDERTRNTKKNTYQLRMWLTDVEDGTVIWEKVSQPIAKKYTRPIIGL